MSATETTKTAWKKNAVHEVTLPSSTKVTIKLPNLAEMVRTGAFPNKLLPIAVKQIAADEVDEDKVKDLAEYHRFLVSHMVIKPAVEEDDVPDLPSEDVDMLVAIANRERDMDAVGHHLSGLETDEEFRKFRNLDRSSSNLYDFS